MRPRLQTFQPACLGSSPRSTTSYVIAGKSLKFPRSCCTHLWKGTDLSLGDKAHQVQRLEYVKLIVGALSPLSLGYEDTAGGKEHVSPRGTRADTENITRLYICPTDGRGRQADFQPKQTEPNGLEHLFRIRALSSLGHLLLLGGENNSFRSKTQSDGGGGRGVMDGQQEERNC